MHHWSGIPARKVEGHSTGDEHKQSIKCQALRVIVIDEAGMLSAELLGGLEYVVKQAIRIRGTYKKRPDGTTRVFGGVNLVMCVDFWQLPPVTGTYLCTNPLDLPAGRAQNAMNLFWGDGPDTIRNFWSLTELMRCRDSWYNEFLKQCREGCLTADYYCFIHGLSTFTASIQNCSCNDDVTPDAVLGSYKRSWKIFFLLVGLIWTM